MTTLFCDHCSAKIGDEGVIIQETEHDDRIRINLTRQGRTTTVTLGKGSMQFCSLDCFNRHLKQMVMDVRVQHHHDLVARTIEWTADDFKFMTGREPDYDDLNRVNCTHAGAVGHNRCGVCQQCHSPKFMCVCE